MFNQTVQKSRTYRTPFTHPSLDQVFSWMSSRASCGPVEMELPPRRILNAASWEEQSELRGSQWQGSRADNQGKGHRPRLPLTWLTLSGDMVSTVGTENGCWLQNVEDDVTGKHGMGKTTAE
ncbi:uncharacterized protein PADG_03970 [Paracoccidioides brasiliensis Pb18]|uniref:Uncharacterized protein n=1 Tax=Paracoccidioides brasiliensis (strain Pb18) TaxID=502780 RepID=C1G9N4_PARBD|nr:uncharacterized protein PADG_03970 [Paracoccidioides brasiliensis Pb18]EEH47886.2 hypothetical protein PADG_03970 [Paracoccidioides brasiliensis Pb18]